MKCRKSVRDLLPAEKTAYRNAVVALKTAPSLIPGRQPPRLLADDHFVVQRDAAAVATKVATELTETLETRAPTALRESRESHFPSIAAR